MRILVLHGYSAANLGDGLLVAETLELLQEAFGADVDLTIAASQPVTFSALPHRVIDSMPRWNGYDPSYRAVLRDIDEFDLVVAVGGGYLRAGRPIEALKTLLVHGPQLHAAARTTAPTFYMPQSIGPARGGTRRIFEALLRAVDMVHVRDDRSLEQFRRAGVHRTPDLAVLASERSWPQEDSVPDLHPVFSIRAIHGSVPATVMDLARRLEGVGYDAYIQSQTGTGNDDRAATEKLSPRRVIDRTELMTPGAGPTRVVVAVRLHASLMALAAGHFVIHLAYERKGFGAFADLGISDFVHNVNDFDVDLVSEQIERLRTDQTARRDYARALHSRVTRMPAVRESLVDSLRRTAVSR